MNAIFYLREYFFPSGCGGCGRALLTAEDSGYGLCETCREFLLDASNEKTRCALCGKVLISEKEVCLSCRERDSSNKGLYSEYIQKILALFPYAGKFKSVLTAYKFGKSPGAGNFLAGCLNSAAGGFDFESRGDAAWVPVPPRPGKIRKEGWDQIEYLARLLERKYRRLPVCRCLKRLPSRSQKELNRGERSGNLKGRILCVKPPPKTALIFDDVITTGATLNACAEALLSGGAEKVYGLCLFYD